ncbi:MAG: HAD family hydrolase [Halobacteriota archaeon]
METHTAIDATSFDLFGTLVDVPSPPDPSEAVASELRARGIAVPDDWSVAYARPHIDAPTGAEVPLPSHVRAALASRGVAVRDGDGGVDAAEERVDAAQRRFDAVEGRVDAIAEAVIAAFDHSVETREGAVDAVEAARELGPVGLLSNCSVPGLVRRALARSALDPDAFDAVVTSVGCGWRKPHRRAFAAVADELDVPLSGVVHVGDDPLTDGGAADVCAAALLVDDVPLAELPSYVEAR